MQSQRPGSRPVWDHPRSAVSALLLTRLGEEEGVAASTLLRGTGLRLADLEDPATEVSARQELDVIAHLVDAVGDDSGLGLVAGTRYHLTAYGLWGFMLLSSPTPRSAVDVALRYTELTFAFARVEARQRGDEMQLVISADDLPAGPLSAPVRRFVVEREAAAIRTLVREAFSATFAPRRVTFTFPPPRPPGGRARRDHDILGVEPAWDADETLVAFDASALDEPMPQANAHAAAIALDQCRAMLQRRRARAGTSGQVRDVLVDRLSDPPDAEDAADTLGLGVRTLQRRLADEGTTYRALLDEVREQLAAELLVSGGLTVTEVARRLGYVEVSSFSQAFRRWKGVGPRAFVTAGNAPSGPAR